MTVTGWFKFAVEQQDTLILAHIVIFILLYSPGTDTGHTFRTAQRRLPHSSSELCLDHRSTSGYPRDVACPVIHPRVPTYVSYVSSATQSVLRSLNRAQGLEILYCPSGSH